MSRRGDGLIPAIVIVGADVQLLLDPMQSIVQTIYVASQPPSIVVAAAESVVQPVHFIRNLLNVSSNPPIRPIMTDLPANVLQHSINMVNLPLE